VTDGTVTLIGRVPDDELKARAEEVARSVKGVRRVINRIVVQSQ
jgi:osmotically-inducible protein OsmY